MRNIIDMCNVNISNSLHSLYEASLLDIEGIINDGELLIDQFNMLKQYIFDVNNYKKRSSVFYTIEINDIKLLLAAIGFNNQKDLKIEVLKSRKFIKQIHNYGVCWTYTLINEHGDNVVIETSSVNGISFKTFINKELPRYIDNINDFMQNYKITH